MKILYILKQEPDETLKKFMEVHGGSHDVSVTDIRKNKNYAQIIELIEQSDRLISW